MVLDSPSPTRIVSTKHTVRNQYAPPSLENDENVPPTSEDNPTPFEFKTPSTTRFKNALAGSITPKHRVKLGGSTLLTPRTPRTIQSSPSKSDTVFVAARQLFVNSGTSGKFVGRDAERTQLRSFITTAIESRSGGCTYISGPPGTGKSALTQEIIEHFTGDERVKIANVNCVSLGSIKEMHRQLVREFCPITLSTKHDEKKLLEDLFTPKKRKGTTMHIVLLDEIDNLLNEDCDVLYSLFVWSLQKQSNLILIGIANALDLTDRFLPRLKSRNLKPELLPFLPYTASQMSTIITERLRSTLPENTTAARDFVPFVHPIAVQLCCKKVASQTGDLRKAFSLIRRAIDQLERETAEKAKSSVPGTPTKRPLGEASNQPYPPSLPNFSPLKPMSIEEIFSPKLRTPVMTPETAPRATIAHIARIASSIFNNGTISRLDSLNLQQKAVLCSLVANEQKRAQRNPFITPSRSTNTVPTVKDLFMKYTMLCKREDGLLQVLKNTEFRDVVASLETLGLVHEWSGRSTSLLTPPRTPSRSGKNADDRQIASAVSEKEMKESLNGAGGALLWGLFDD
jgi:cell division control protein 6